jgi:carbamoyltransferase
MLVLGLSGGLEGPGENLYDLRFDEIHDSAAVLVRDGNVIAGVEQERLNRIKHTNKAPGDAIRACLRIAGIAASDLDAVAYYATEPFCDRVLEQLHLRNLSAPELLTGRTMVQRIVRQATGYELDPSRVRFVGHHQAHAVSAFHQSGFHDALVVSLDGQGEGVSGMVFAGRGGRLDHLRSIPEQDSLGYLYRDVIRFLGYEMFDEYKVMGMAPYGDPARFRQAFRPFYELLPDGAYRLHLDRVATLYRLAAPRRKGEAFDKTHQDMAAALQQALETIALHVMAHFARATGRRRLCLAGGVAHNCSMNGKLISSGLFDELFVQPAAHDAGCALGSALTIDLAERPGAAVAPLRDVYWGDAIGDETSIERSLSRWSAFLSIERRDDVCATAADLIAAGQVIGWVQGRSEFGPRALGNRSILADPRPEGHKTAINAMVKKREAYRPFAPSVLEERAAEFFVLPARQTRFPYMSVILEVRPEHRSRLGAVTHVDGTARIQTVARDENPRYYELIEKFAERSGVPMVLNTSFNNHAEPIVDSVEDAIVCFLTTGLDALFVGDWLARKKPVAAAAWADLTITLAPNLVLRQVAGDDGARRCEAAFSYHHGRVMTISPKMFDLLRQDGAARRLQPSEADELANELVDLWTVRMLNLEPWNPRTLEP